MMKLRLDYQRSMKPFPVAGAALLAVAVSASLVAAEYYHRLNGETAEWDASLAKIERASGSRGAGTGSGMRVRPEDFKKANEVMQQLTLPWDDIFRAVESSTDRQITLLGMEPDMEKRVVTISCEARNVAAMLNFVRRLETQPEFGSVYLQSHEIQELDPDRPVRFSLVAIWRVPA